MQIHEAGRAVYDKIRDPSTLLGMGMAALALSGGPLAHEAEATPINPEAAVMHQLNQDMANGTQVEVDYQHDVLWSGPGFPADQYQYRTHDPIVQFVDGKPRYFAVKQKGATLDTLRTSIIPSDATVVVNDVSQSPSGIIKEYGGLGFYKYRSIGLTATKQASFKRYSQKYGLEKIPVGLTSSAEPQIPADYGGKRFASTSMFDELQTVQTASDVAAVLQKFASQYNIKINIGDPTGQDRVLKDTGYQTKPVSDVNLTELKDAGGIFMDEFSKYPLAAVERLGVKAITFVDEMKTPTITAEGLYTGNIAYDVSTLIPRKNLRDLHFYENYFRESVDHEVGHAAVHADLNGTAQLDTWANLNQPDFVYQDQKKQPTCVEHDVNCVTKGDTYSGFVTNYAATNVGEDMAETNGYLMSSLAHDQLETWNQTDPTLAEKTRRVKQMWNDLSDGFMNDAYFAAVNP